MLWIEDARVVAAPVSLISVHQKSSSWPGQQRRKLLLSNTHLLNDATANVNLETKTQKYDMDMLTHDFTGQIFWGAQCQYFYPMVIFDIHELAADMLVKSFQMAM